MTEPSVDAYVAGLAPEQGAIAEALRMLVRSAAPDAEEAFKWAQPVFESNGPFAYIKAFPQYINFGFWRGVELDSGRGLLESGGEKMAHVKLRSKSDIKEAELARLVKAAVKLNRDKGDPSRSR